MEEELRLKTLEKDDLEFLHQLNNNPGIMKYWFEEPYMSMESLKDMYEKSQENTRHRQFILYLMEEKIGYVGLFNLEQRHNNAEFGIMIDPTHQGKGYAIKATTLALDYAFTWLNLHKVYLYVDSLNEKAVHIYKKAGFHVEGEIKEHFFVNGEYHDAVIMSVFHRDYLKAGK